MPDPTLRRAAAAVARRPVLWPTAVVAAARHAPRRWWRHPRQAAAGPWVRFRMETNYGAEATGPEADDLVTWLRWCRAWPRARR